MNNLHSFSSGFRVNVTWLYFPYNSEYVWGPWKEYTLCQTTGTSNLKWNVRMWPIQEKLTVHDWEHFEVLTNQKHINSSPANAKAWRITRLLQQPYSSLYTCSPSSITDVRILEDHSSRWHWSFTLSFPPAPNPADSPYIWSALRSWYTIRYIVEKMFLKTFLNTSAPVFRCKWVTFKDCINVMLILSQK